MGRTLAELQQDMSSQEFSLWLQFYQDEQWGDASAERRADLRAGVVAATIGNFAGMTRKKGAEPLQPSDFFPDSLSAAEPDEPVAEIDPIAHFTAISKTAKLHKKG